MLAILHWLLSAFFQPEGMAPCAFFLPLLSYHLLINFFLECVNPLPNTSTHTHSLTTT